MIIFRYGGHNVQLDSSFKFGVDNLTPAFLKKFPLGKVVMVLMMMWWCWWLWYVEVTGRLGAWMCFDV